MKMARGKDSFPMVVAVALVVAVVLAVVVVVVENVALSQARLSCSTLLALHSCGMGGSKAFLLAVLSVSHQHDRWYRTST